MHFSGASTRYDILSRAEGFEKCSQNEVRVGYLSLESNISNWSNTAYLKTKVDMLFFTIKHCNFFFFFFFYTRDRSWRRGYGGKMYAHGYFFFFFFFFFFAIWSPIFSFFLSLFPSLFFCLFLHISYAGPFEPLLIGVDWAALWRYNGKPNIFGSKIWPFFFLFCCFLLRKLFAPFFYMLEGSCSYYYYPA